MTEPTSTVAAATTMTINRDLVAWLECFQRLNGSRNRSDALDEVLAIVPPNLVPNREDVAWLLEEYAYRTSPRKVTGIFRRDYTNAPRRIPVSASAVRILEERVRALPHHLQMSPVSLCMLILCWASEADVRL